MFDSRFSLLTFRNLESPDYEKDRFMKYIFIGFGLPSFSTAMYFVIVALSHSYWNVGEKIGITILTIYAIMLIGDAVLLIMSIVTAIRLFRTDESSRSNRLIYEKKR